MAKDIKSARRSIRSQQDGLYERLIRQDNDAGNSEKYPNASQVHQETPGNPMAAGQKRWEVIFLAPWGV